MPVQRIGQIVLGNRHITADTDLRLCRFFGILSECLQSINRANRVWSRSEARSFCACDSPCETFLVKLLAGNISH